MLEAICDFVHNYFEVCTTLGSFTIADNNITGFSLLEGQRFRIKGSALNDGIYTYQHGGILDDDGIDAVELLPETFEGSVTAMGVPRRFLELAAEIRTWCDKNADRLNNPYTSESFDGYTYTKATGSGANAGGFLTWQDVFKTRLNAYRKIG